MTVTVAVTASRTRFQLLGPVRAWSGMPGAEEELDLGPAKQRAVLAVLLLNVGTPISTQRMVDAVWGDEPPANGANVVQKYVAGLRRVLEPARSPRSPGQVISLTDAGYVLTVDPLAVDADVFAAWVAAGVASQRAGRPHEAATTLVEALGLWQGEPLAALPGPWFAGARNRLMDSRALAYETWAAAELDLGHHDRLVVELRRLVEEYPMRERLHELLMLAFYRCGRRAEALAVFRDARQLLVEHVGTEPGRPLRDLHQRMLASDPALEVPAGGPRIPAVAPAAAGVAAPAAEWTTRGPAGRDLARSDLPGDGSEAREPAWRLEGGEHAGHFAGPAVNGWPRERGEVGIEPGDPRLATEPGDPGRREPGDPGRRGEPGDPGGPVAVGGWAARPADSGWRQGLRRVCRSLAVVAPLMSMGMLTWAFFGYYAVRRRSSFLAVVSVVYFVLLVLAISLLGQTKSSPAEDLTGFLAWLMVVVGGTAHLADVVYAERSWAHRR